MSIKVKRRSSIGFKELTEADLGHGDGNQTHIGLYDQSINFANYKYNKSKSLFVFDNTIREVLCFMNLIQREDGVKNAPKIRKGINGDLFYKNVYYKSVVREVRDIVNAFKKNGVKDTWFLVWFELSDDSLSFFLFRKKSDDYKNIQNLISNSANISVTNHTDVNYKKIVNYLERKLKISKPVETKRILNINTKFIKV